MPFFECEFPTAISFMPVGGPRFSTEVKVGASGHEQRNRNWQFALSKWKVDLHYKKHNTYFEKVRDFWLNVGGRADGFRFKDHTDFKATGQQIGVGDGVKQDFQLIKTYAVGPRTYTRTIEKPITASVIKFDGTAMSDTVKIYLNGVLKTVTTDYTLDYTTGLVHFLAPVGNTVVVTADFQFHFKVRFDMDDFNATIEESDVLNNDAHISWPDINLVEYRA